MEEWQRESRQLKRDTGERVEDGFGVALPNCAEAADRQ